MTENQKKAFSYKKAALSVMTAAFVVLYTTVSFADTAEVSTAEELYTAISGGISNIDVVSDITTSEDINIPPSSVVNLNGNTWTVASGTAKIAGTVDGGNLKVTNGTVRKPETISLENVGGSQVVQSVTYSDSEKDSASGSIKGNTVSGSGTASLWVKTENSGANKKTITRVGTDDGSYRTGTATGELSRVYSISYNLDGGTVSGSNPKEYTASDQPIALSNPTREGYIFLGWSGSGINDGTKNVVISMGSTGDRSYTALWEEDPEYKGMMNGGRAGFGGWKSGFSGLLSGISGSTETENADEIISDADVPEGDISSAAANAPGSSRGKRLSVATSKTKAIFTDKAPKEETVTVERPVGQLTNMNSANSDIQLYIGGGLAGAAVAGLIMMAVLSKKRRKN